MVNRKTKLPSSGNACGSASTTPRDFPPHSRQSMHPRLPRRGSVCTLAAILRPDAPLLSRSGRTSTHGKGCSKRHAHEAGRLPTVPPHSPANRARQRRSCSTPSIWLRYPYLCRERLRSECRNRQERSSFSRPVFPKTIQTAASAKTPNVPNRIVFNRPRRPGAFPARPHELLHRLPLLIPRAEVTLANGLPHEFRHGRLPAPRARVQGIPEVIVEIELRPPHDV